VSRDKGTEGTQPDMRTAIHPGVAAPCRIITLPVMAADPEMLPIPPGADLIETVHRHLDAIAAAGATFSLHQGAFARLTLMTGGAGTGDMPMTFRGPHVLQAPLRIVAGAAMSGMDMEGRRVTHCHAVFDDATGQRVGGHLLIGEAIAGEEGVLIEFTVLASGRMRQRADAETGFVIFHPEHA
jgi:predicted DNA-binding protein with PD1-like motif